MAPGCASLSNGTFSIEGGDGVEGGEQIVNITAWKTTWHDEVENAEFLVQVRAVKVEHIRLTAWVESTWLSTS